MNKEQIRKNLVMPDKKIDVVMDTDAFAELDDQFAISYMIKAKEKLNVKAIYAAPFDDVHVADTKDGMGKSYSEVLNILDLMDEEALKKNVYKGADKFMTDEAVPVVSDAAKHLAELADSYTSEEPLYVIGIAAITNIASAILINPGIVEKIVVIWLGGHSRDYENTEEFNMMHDLPATRVVFSSGVPIVQLPCEGVVSEFSMSNFEMEECLKGKNKVCDYLFKHSKDVVNRGGKKQTEWKRVIWDVAAVGWLLNENEKFMKSKILNIRMPGYDFKYSEQESENLMSYVYYIDRDALMKDMVEKITK